MALEIWDGRSVTHGATLLLAARDASMGEAAGPWSIAELHLTDLDFEKLLFWSRQAAGDAVKSLIERTDLFPLPKPRACDVLPGDVVAGLLLIALCAECTARQGSTEAPWRSVVEAIGECSLRRALFTPRGDPLRPLRDALLAAARRCWLRSGDLDDPTANRWYQLLLLQGGVPQHDVALLPRWLSNPDGRTFLVDALQRDVPTFRAAWEALERLRRGQMSRDRARQCLAACPFFREPHEEILEAALRSLEPGEGRGSPPSASALSASVCLAWPRGEPWPRAILIPAFSPDEALGSPVDLLVDGVQKARYRRNKGVLTRFGTGEVAVPLALSWALSAKGVAEADVEEASVDLFHDDADIACFDEAGTRCGTEAQIVRYVVAREPIVTRPEQRVAWIECQGLAAAAVEPGTVVTTIDGVHLWPWNRGAHSADTQALTLCLAEVHHGTELGALTVRITHAPAVRLRAGRVGSAPFRVRTSAEYDVGTTLLEGVVPAPSATPETRLTVTANIADRAFQRTLRFRAFTAASIDGKWLAPTSVLEADRLRGGALRVSLGPEFTGKDARLVTGGVSARIVLDARHAPRVRALGYGEPLLLCGQEPWLEGPHRILADRIEDHGQVVGHEVLDGRVRITHRLNIETAAEHWLLIWPRRGVPVALPLCADAGRSEEHAFTVPYRADGEPRALALCYGSAVAGASWTKDWSSGLVDSEVGADQLVKLIRALSLPVLASAHLRPVAERLRQLGLPDSTVALVENHGDEEPLTIGAYNVRSSGDRDRWPCVARAVLLELRLSAEEQVLKLKKRIDDRFPPPKLMPGIPATPEQLEDLERRRQAQGGSTAPYLPLLLRAGAIHPRDAVCLTPNIRRERDRLAINLADLSRGLNARALEGESDGSKRRLRASRLAVRRRQLGLVEESLPSTLAAVAAWSQSTESPDILLHAALVDERMQQRIQIELLDELAFPGK